jgi:S-disulfanyl-L-cysteine oxidoreductase SoxD
MQKQARNTLLGIIAIAIGIVAYGLLFGHARSTASEWIAPAQGEQWIQGQQIYTTYCAACHGVKLEGQPNWRSRMANGRLPAPPHDVTGHTWHHPDWQLIGMIRDGLVPGVTAPARYESDMPGFAKILSDEQIRLVLGYIKSYWPEDILKAQREISLK